MQRASARQKGKDFEKLVGKILGMWWSGYPYPRAHGSGSSTTQSSILYSGNQLFYAGDLYCPPRFPWCVECKFHNEWTFDSLIQDTFADFWSWWRQCCRDAAKINKMPMLVFRKNNYHSHVIVKVGEFFSLYFSPLPFTHTIIHHEEIWYVVMELDNLVSLPAVSMKEKVCGNFEISDQSSDKETSL